LNRFETNNALRYLIGSNGNVVTPISVPIASSSYGTVLSSNVIPAHLTNPNNSYGSVSVRNSSTHSRSETVSRTSHQGFLRYF